MVSRLQNEIEAWNKFKNGDDSMFVDVYSLYSRQMYQYGLKFTRNTSLIEDSIHDLFFELYKNRRTIGHTDNILRYLLKSFRRKLFRHLNREKRYSFQKESKDYSFEVDYSIEHELILIEDKDLKTAVLRKALQNISSRQREAIYLRFTSGLAYENVAEIMDMNLESCRNLIYRAIKSLKEAIHDHDKSE